ncbi:unnamed protein product [Leptosia nina]|uniref:Uncharacterized protein n=1 Tax=Leptosia nina TaxID=320188 RepID=A0AAV1K6T7_9NEOP
MADADWAAYESKKKSSWRLEEALSTAEAEYMALLTLYNDNMAANKLANNSMTGKRSKHISIKDFIRECFQREDIILKYKPTYDMEADIMTKGLQPSADCAN